MDDHQTSFVFVVPTKYVGLIIGKSGTFSKRILNETQAQLVFQLKDDMPENSQERAVAIFGECKEIYRVVDRIFEHIDNSMKNSPHTESKSEQSSKSSEHDNEYGGSSRDESLVKWLISQSVCGSLIGKKGDGIKSIYRMSGAWVKVAHADEYSNKNAERCEFSLFLSSLYSFCIYIFAYCNIILSNAFSIKPV